MATSPEKLGGRTSASSSVSTASPHRLPTRAALRAAAWLIRRHAGRLLLGFLLLMVNRLCGLAVPLTVRRFMDDVVGRDQFDLLPALASQIALAALVGAATTFAVSQVLGVAAAQAIAEARANTFARVIRWPIRRLDRTPTGELLSRGWTEVEGIRTFVGRDLVQFVTSLVTALGTIVILVSINLPLTVRVITLVGGFGAAIAIASTRLRPLFVQRGVMLAEMTRRLTEAIGGIRVVKAYAAEPREDALFASATESLFENVRRTTTGAAAISAGATTMLGLTAIVVMVSGGAAVREGQMTVGEVAMYVSFVALLTLPVVQLASLGGPLGEAFASLERMADLRAIPTEDEDETERSGNAPARAKDAKETTAHSTGDDRRGDVVLDDVTFAYGTGVAALQSVSLTARAGSTTALVGPSGAGKTTLVSLVMALHRPTSGRILVDGRDLATIAAAEHRRHVGVVLQDDFFFDGTVAENIAFSVPDASDEAIRRAGRRAHCDGFVEAWPAGYDTVIGERGVRLSGGQRQRVSIARALLADPAILILDEATSSLDSETEAAVQEALRVLRQGRTTFVIAHRLSTIISADQIVVLERGRVVEVGSHRALLQRNGRYRQLYDQQYRHVDADVTHDAQPVAPGTVS